MTVEKIDNSRLLICLGNSDMEKLSMQKSKMSLKDESFKEAVKSLLTLAVFETNISISGKKALVEAFPHEDGCLMLVSFVSSDRSKKKYRIKKCQKNVFMFESLEDFVSLSVQASKNEIHFPHNTIYEYKGKYWLITEQLPYKAENLAKEYSSKLNKNENRILTICARLEEYGEKIPVDDAVEKIGKAMA